MSKIRRIPRGLIVNIARIRAEWKALRDRWPNKAATPDELAAFIEKTGDDNAERQKLLAAYRYYLEHQTHQDMSLWENRSKIRPIKVNRIGEGTD